MKLYFTHLFPTNNIGDLNCCPQKYFEEFKSCSVCPFANMPKDNNPVVLGGGGMFMPHTENTIFKIAKKRPLIIWGAGLNYNMNHFPAGIETKLRECALVGMRDKEFVQKHNFDWVPCSSCLSNLFDKYKDTKPKHDIVVYRHCHFNEPNFENCPTLTNNIKDAKSFENAISHLASGRVIMTNSFHGAYWSLLLGRIPIIFKLISMRLISALPPLPVVNDVPSAKYIAEHFAEKYRQVGYLETCRTANMDFFKKVMNLVG